MYEKGIETFKTGQLLIKGKIKNQMSPNTEHWVWDGVLHAAIMQKFYLANYASFVMTPAPRSKLWTITDLLTGFNFNPEWMSEQEYKEVKA